MAYAVVLFTEDGVISEIPTNWLQKDKDDTLCWWPPTHVKNLTSLIVKRVEPDIKIWSLHPVKVEKYCTTLERARKVAEFENYSSTDEMQLGKGCRKKISKKYIYSQDESEEDAINTNNKHNHDKSNIKMKRKSEKKTEMPKWPETQNNETDFTLSTSPSPSSNTNIEGETLSRSSSVEAQKEIENGSRKKQSIPDSFKRRNNAHSLLDEVPKRIVRSNQDLFERNDEHSLQDEHLLGDRVARGIEHSSRDPKRTDRSSQDLFERNDEHSLQDEHLLGDRVARGIEHSSRDPKRTDRSSQDQFERNDEHSLQDEHLLGDRVARGIEHSSRDPKRTNRSSQDLFERNDEHSLQDEHLFGDRVAREIEHSSRNLFKKKNDHLFQETLLIKNTEANTRTLIRMVAELQLQIKDIFQRIDRITPKTKIVSSIERIRNCLPLKSIEDIKSLETRLQQADFVDEYKTFLLKIGGHTPRENIRNVLTRIFSNECSIKCSWKGRRDNFAIYKLRLITIMKEIILEEHANLTEKELDDISAEWFRFGKQRKDREKKDLA